MADLRPFDRHWYADQIHYADKLRAEGHPLHLQAAVAAAQQALDLGRQVQLHLDRPWHERLFTRFPHQAFTLLRPKHRRDLLAYLALALPNFEHLRDLLADDQCQVAGNLAATVLDPPAPEIGPIGPRSRPSSFAAHLEFYRELL